MNQDPYVDRNNIAVAMPGGLALNEWKNVHGVVFPPRLTCLTEVEIKHALKMVDLLFVITHVDFLAEGALRPVLVCAFGTLVMYYPQIAKEFGMEHVLPLLICNAAIAEDIHLVKVKGTSAHCVLVDWATRIKDNYKE